MSEPTNPSPKAAWDGDPPQAAAARARLLAATSRCMERNGLPGTSVAAIAVEAGVSRQTVYRYFTGRDDLAKHTIFAAADRLGEQITSQVALLTDPADIVVEAMILGLAEVRSHPVLRAMWDSASPEGLVAALFTHPGGIAWARQTLDRAVELAGWSDDEATMAIEFFLRVGLSFLISTSPGRTSDELRAFLYRHLVPGLGLADATPTRR